MEATPTSIAPPFFKTLLLFVVIILKPLSPLRVYVSVIVNCSNYPCVYLHLELRPSGRGLTWKRFIWIKN